MTDGEDGVSSMALRCLIVELEGGDGILVIVARDRRERWEDMIKHANKL